MAEPHDKTTPTLPDPTYEDRDINIPMIVISIVALVAITVASMVGLRVMFRVYEDKVYAPLDASSPFLMETERPTTAVLQVDEVSDLDVHRANEDDVLHREPGWLDREAGIASVSLDVAMQVIAQKGLPAREGRVD